MRCRAQRKVDRSRGAGVRACWLASPSLRLRSQSDWPSALAVLHKPFSPLELIELIDGLGEVPTELLVRRSEGDAEQLLVYARDLSRIAELERSQRRLLQQAYRQTVAALAVALEAKDPGTGLRRAGGNRTPDSDRPREVARPPR